MAIGARSCICVGGGQASDASEDRRVRVGDAVVRVETSCRNEIASYICQTTLAFKFREYTIEPLLTCLFLSFLDWSSLSPIWILPQAVVITRHFDISWYYNSAVYKSCPYRGFHNYRLIGDGYVFIIRMQRLDDTLNGQYLKQHCIIARRST